jgi:hypothetical protein
MPVEPFLQRHLADKAVDIEDLRSFHFSGDLKAPWASLKFVNVFPDIFLQAEFVKIVVLRGNALVRQGAIELEFRVAFGRIEAARRRLGNVWVKFRFDSEGCLRTTDLSIGGVQTCSTEDGNTQFFQDFPPVQIHRLWRR